MRVAVVTGGSSGIGAALARRLAERSFRCILVARGSDRLRRTAASVGAEAEVCDVSDRAAVEELASRIGARHRAVHLLVNNAGIPGRGGFLDLEPDRIERVLHVNYLGGVWCVRAFLPLLEAAAGAHVVNVASVAGTVAAGTAGPYAASKFAQVAFSRSIASELASRQIRIHTVNPGFTQTEGFPQDDLLARPLLRRLVVDPDRVARAIVAAVALDRRETFVPAAFRLVAALEGLAPSSLSRLASSRPWRR